VQQGRLILALICAHSGLLAELQQRFASLTPRQQEVTSMVVSGMLNKQIAGQLGTAENTAKGHRSRAMEKIAERAW
jgi:FixJ family two-component response regulator